jgi:6-phosphogluconolactonase
MDGDPRGDNSRNHADRGMQRAIDYKRHTRARGDRRGFRHCRDPICPFQTGLHPVALCITSNERFLYVASSGGRNVSAFAISNSGALTQDGTPSPAGFSPLNVARMRPEISSYVTSAVDNSLSAFRIDQSAGTLSRIAGSSLTVGSARVAITANPRGRYVHVLRAANSTLTTYLIGAQTGQLTQIGQSQTGFQPSALAIAPSGGIIYTVNAGDGTISEFALDQQTGATRTLAGSPVPTGLNPLGIAIDSRGRFAYVANFNSNEIWGYSIGADGTLHQLPGSKALAAPRPKGIAVAPNRSVLYVTNVDTNVVSAYAIGDDDSLLQPLFH